MSAHLLLELVERGLYCQRFLCFIKEGVMRGKKGAELMSTHLLLDCALLLGRETTTLHSSPAGYNVTRTGLEKGAHEIRVRPSSLLSTSGS